MATEAQVKLEGMIKSAVEAATEESNLTSKALQDEITDMKAELKVMKEYASKNETTPVWKDHMELLSAIKDAAYGNVDKRLIKSAIQGVNTGKGSEGAYTTEFATIANPLVDDQSIASYCTPRAMSSQIEEFTYHKGFDRSGLLINGGQSWGIVVEGETIDKGTPQWGPITLKLHKLGSVSYTTGEMDKFSKENIAGLFKGGADSGLVLLMNHQLVNGSGAAELNSFLGAACLETVTRSAGNTIAVTDISKMEAQFYGDTGLWLASRTIKPQIDALMIGNAPMFTETYRDRQTYSVLRGKPVIFCDSCPILGTTGDLTLIDPKQMLVGNAGGVDAAVSTAVEFITDQTAYRFIFYAGSVHTWAESYNPPKGANRGPVVVLS